MKPPGRRTANGSKAVVLGAGLQGSCVALALAQKGYQVVLLEQAADCLLRASLRNEGKIHLGLVYANDASMRTAGLMVEAAIHFGPVIDEIVGHPLPWHAMRSRPFTYVIPKDSMLSADELMGHYERVQDLYRDQLDGDSSLHYVSARPRRLWTTRPLPRGVATDRAVAAVATPEVSVDLVRLREHIRTALRSSSGVTAKYGHRVEGIARVTAGFALEGVDPSGKLWSQKADVVVNCTWESRLRLDRQLGLTAKRPWVYRLKYRLLGTLPEGLRDLPSMTFVLGRYGDVVTYPDRADVYVSWYPTCMRGWCTETEIPQQWEAACNGDVPASASHDLTRTTLAAFNELVPGLRRCAIDTVDAGVIFSWGRSDIDRHDSELHDRFDVGIEEVNGYYSIDTGKLTTAPLFARDLADRL